MRQREIKFRAWNTKSKKMVFIFPFYSLDNFKIDVMTDGEKFEYWDREDTV